jgi:hypothetical protein
MGANLIELDIREMEIIHREREELGTNLTSRSRKRSHLPYLLNKVRHFNFHPSPPKTTTNPIPRLCLLSSAAPFLCLLGGQR